MIHCKLNKILPVLVLGSACMISYSRPKAVNIFTEERISTVKKWLYTIQDFFLGCENLALTDVSPDVEDFVRKIQSQMEMDHMTIRLRSMSRYAKSLLGRENLAVISFPYANTILISEEWFKSLPEQEQRALIGHELAHIRNKHAYKQLAIACLPLVNILLVPLYSRMCELDADTVSAKELDNIDGCIDLFKRFKSLKDPHSRFAIKRLIRRIRKIITYPARKLFASHPSLSKRIKNLEALKEDYK